MAVMTESDAGQRRETRWSANKKADVVLRLLRGEPLDEVSRQVGVEVHRLAAWRDEFLATGKQGAEGSAGDRGRGECRAASAAAGGRTQGWRVDLGQRHPARRGAKRGLEIPPAKRPR